MGQLNIFISVGATATIQQETFIAAVEERLRSEGLHPNTVGRNRFSAGSPLQAINQCMDECCGTIIIALERTYFPSGIEKRGGSKESKLSEVKFPTPWNQIEAAMTYVKGLPLLLIIEEGLKNEGLLETGYDWYVMWIKPEKASLSTPEFNGILADWKKKAELYCNSKQQQTSATKEIDLSGLTVIKILKNLKTAELWGILGALAAMVALAFAIGQRFPPTP